MSASSGIGAGTTGYLAHFGLAGAPFVKEISDTDLWLPPSKAEIVDGLVEAADERDSGILVGESGAGKTCVMRALRQRLQGPRYRLTYNHNSTLGKRDFYRQLCVALGLTPSATAAAVFFAVSTHVQQLGQERIHPVFLLDEAHLLQPDTLDHLHILLNYDWDSRALLSIFLVGLTDLVDRLELRRHRSLYSRISRRFVISPLTANDTADYLRFRLKLVGCERDLFADDAKALLHEHAQGTLRDLDRLATAGLREAAKRKRKQVAAEDIDHVTLLGGGGAS